MKKTLLPFLLSASLIFAEEIPVEETPVEMSDSCDCNPSCGTMILTLEESIHRALMYNRQLLASANTLSGAQLRLEMAYSDYDLKMRPIARGGYSGGGYKGSGLDLGAGLIWEKKWTSGTKMLISPYVRRLQKGTQIDVDASITQPIFRGFNSEYNLSGLRAAQFSNRSAVRSLHIAQAGLVSKVITTLYENVKLKKTLEIQKECCTCIKKYQRIAKLKEERDLSESGELFKIETELTSAEETVRNTEVKLKDNQDAIRELLVLEPAQCFEVDLPLQPPTCEIDCAKAIEIALNRRTEIEQCLDDVKEKMRLSEVAKTNLKPDIDLVMRFNNTGYDRYFRDIKLRPETTWTISVSTSTDFERVTEKIGYDQSLINVDNAITALDQMKEKIIVEVKRNHRALQRSIENYCLQETKLASLRGEMKFNLRKYEKGQTKIGDLMKNEQNICAAQISLFTTSIDQIVGDFSLKASMGLLIDKPVINA